MITLCIHCLKPVEKLTANILATEGTVATDIPDGEDDTEAVPAREAKSFVVSVQRLHTSFSQQTGKAELMLDVITEEPGITPEDVRAVGQYLCTECGEVLNPQIHCYNIKGRELNPNPERESQNPDDLPAPGEIIVATMGANSRFDLRTHREIREAVSEMVEFSAPEDTQSVGDAKKNWEWDS